MLPKHSALPFALNWSTFVALTNKKLLFPLKCRLDRNLFLDCVKLIHYFASAVNMISSNPYVGPSPGIKISFPVSTWIDELISSPKMTFFS